MDKFINAIYSLQETDIKLLSKIFENILTNPNDSKYQNLNSNAIQQKAMNYTITLQLLFTSGFYESNDSRLLYDMQKINNLKLWNQLIKSDEFNKIINNNNDKLKENKKRKEPQNTAYIIVSGYAHETEKVLRNIVSTAVIHLCVAFYFDQIAADMVFDEYGMNKSRMKIVNEKQVKCLTGYHTHQEAWGVYGSSIRMKCAMPIAARGNNKYNVRSISWEIKQTATSWFPGSGFIGVVSNRNTDFMKGGLIDAFGMRGSDVFNASRKVRHVSFYPRNAIVKVQYKINESTLLFTYGNGKTLCEMTLPELIDGITHWYPCISLLDKDDTCKILNVQVKYELRVFKQKKHQQM